MAKKARKALYTQAKFYYMNAYRVRMKAIRQDWTTDDSAIEREADPTVTDHAADPDEGDVMPETYVFADAATQTEVDGEREEVEASKNPAAAVQQEDRPVNNTNFTYMAAAAQMNARLPSMPEGNLDGSKKRTLLEAGLGDPERERIGKRWHGAHFLGQGATGSCSLWLRTDRNDNIDERLAVRDVAAIHQNAWINPINWRDQLPREIAILRRLDEQEGAENNIHRYFGHRIDAAARRYRVYNEVCDLGSLENLLQWYSRLWRRRRNHFRWLQAHPITEQPQDEDEPVSPGGKESALRDTRAEKYQEYLDDKRKDPEHHVDKEFDDMSGLDQFCSDEFDENLPPVIPEAFLWQVFDQLAGAALIMQRGANPLVGRKKWKEIVHKDLHTRNIFVKPTEEGFFGRDPKPDPRALSDSFAKFKKSGYPNVVLADFDTAFFDLQDDGDEYQDNPTHYMLRNKGSDATLSARYPPEVFWDYQVLSNVTQWTKLTSATDVWGIGQIMWNLAMNLPYDSDYVAPFYDDSASSAGKTPARRLNNGKPYALTDLDRYLLTGDKPYEASGQYSDKLKTTIRQCLQYHPRFRPKIEDLKVTTETYRRNIMEEDEDSEKPMVNKEDEDPETLIVKVEGSMNDFKVGGGYPPRREQQ
ncbi:hypothetical protein N0V94_004770 [Neodidymelliopsis sp. IMI 364377]|nr:hypothetical protein N0V94_004770 [Neodidymelliopsis sp. IMI 364377]